jgi:hypothetical protein
MGFHKNWNARNASDGYPSGILNYHSGYSCRNRLQFAPVVCRQPRCERMSFSRTQHVFTDEHFVVFLLYLDCVEILFFLCRKNGKYFGFEVLLVVTMESTVFLHVTPCNLERVRRFGRTQSKKPT